MNIITISIDAAAFFVSLYALYQAYKSSKTAKQTQSEYQEFLKENIRNNYHNIVNELTQNVKDIGLFGTEIWKHGNTYPNLNSIYREISKLNSEIGINLFRVFQLAEFKKYKTSEDILKKNATDLFAMITSGSYETMKFTRNQCLANQISIKTKGFIRLLDQIH